MKGAQKLAIKAQMSMKKENQKITEKNLCDDTRNNKNNIKKGSYLLF